MIAHQKIRMARLNVNFIDFDLVEPAPQKDADKQCTPPKEKRMKRSGLDDHNNKAANLDAKFWLIISWFSSSMTISEGLYLLKKALPIDGR